MNVHFLPDEKYSKPFIDFLRNKYPTNNIFFVISDKPLKYLSEEKDIVFIEWNGFSSLYNIFSKLKKIRYDKLFLHYLDHRKLFIPFMVPHNVDVYWIFWGSDLYDFIDYPIYDDDTKAYLNIKKKRKRSLISRLHILLRKYVVKHKINYVVASEIEYEIIQKFYGTKAKRIDFNYPNPVKENFEFNQRAKCKGNIKKIILLGNSAAIENNHLSVLKKLAELKTDFEVIVPLSYGGSEKYINDVLTLGKDLLGNKFIPLVNLLTPSEYQKILDNVDVCVMNHIRQQAMGNLRYLLSQGKKVYMNKESISRKYFESKGIVLNVIPEHFDESIFDEVSDTVVKNNCEILKDIYDVNKYMGIFV